MNTPEQQFSAIAAQLAVENHEITTGKMMSSPGIRYRNKVIAFFYHEAMVFKLGRAFDPGTFGLHAYQLLSPFKTKPPLRDWFEVAATHSDRWEALARLALQRMREELG
jgi:hypothetical protein